MEINLNTYNDKNTPSVMITVVDISELKKAEKQVKKSLNEKEVLLME